MKDKLYKISLLLNIILLLAISIIIGYSNFEKENYRQKEKFRNLKFEKISVVPNRLNGNPKLMKEMKYMLTLTAFNEQGRKPFVIIGDSVDHEFNIYSNIDTFYSVDYRQIVIKRELNRNGKNMFWGNYHTFDVLGNEIIVPFGVDEYIEHPPTGTLQPPK